MRSFAVVVLLSVVFIPQSAFATSQIYRYTDESGTLNFTNDLQSIPEPYRQRAVPLYMDMTSTAGAVAPAPAAPQAQVQPAIRVVTVSSDYRMGAHDTPTTAVRMAIQSAKRQALEQVATYLESVTEIRNLDVTRDELRAYSAGSITVLDQQTSTRTDNGATVIHVDLTAQVDRNEAVQAIMALRENDSAKQELIALRAESDQLRQQLDAANQALATAQSQEQIQALLTERRRVLDQMQADLTAAEARTAGISGGQGFYGYPWIGGLLFQPQPPHPHTGLGGHHRPYSTPPASPPVGGFPSTGAPPMAPLSPTLPTQSLAVPNDSLAHTRLPAPPMQPTAPPLLQPMAPHGPLTPTPGTSQFFHYGSSSSAGEHAR